MGGVGGRIRCERRAKARLSGGGLAWRPAAVRLTAHGPPPLPNTHQLASFCLGSSHLPVLRLIILHRLPYLKRLAPFSLALVFSPQRPLLLPIPRALQLAGAAMPRAATRPRRRTRHLVGSGLAHQPVASLFIRHRAAASAVAQCTSRAPKSGARPPFKRQRPAPLLACMLHAYKQQALSARSENTSASG